MREIQAMDQLETQASLGVFGTGIDLDSISQELKLQPSHSHRAGDAGLTARPYPQDLWLLESPLPQSETLDAHLNWLRDVTTPYYEFLRTLREEHELRTYCGISSGGNRCEFRISPGALRIFVELGIAMNLTVIFVGDSGSGSPSDTAHEARSHSPGTAASFEVVGEWSDVSRVARGLSPLALYASLGEEPETPAKIEQSAFWAITAPEVRKGGLGAQLIWLASELSPYSSFLRSVTRSVAPLVRCVLRSESDISDQSFSPEGLSFLTSLGIPLEFDAYTIAGS